MKGNKFTNPIAIFKEIWHAFDTTYSGFTIKGIDWDKLYKAYRHRINENTNEEELYRVVTDMLRHLNDNHVQLKTSDPCKRFYAGSIGDIIDEMGYEPTRKLLTSQPLSPNYFKQGTNERDGFTYGWLEEKIGYFHFGAFKNMKASKDAMDHIIRHFSSSKALIIDVRRNMGGDDHIGKAIADCFADRKREYMQTSEKNGSGRKDFTDKKTWCIEPKESVQYLNPVIVLIDRTTFSAAENFALAMRELPHVSLVGDFTSGAYADADWKTLSCGWEVCIPYGIFTDKNGFCWEGIGIPPNYRIKTSATKSPDGRDELIDFSIDLISQN